MKYQLISLYTLLFLFTIIVGCKKSTNAIVPADERSVKQHEQKDDGKVIDELTRQLMIQYGLVELTPEQIGRAEFPTFSDFESASAFVKRAQLAMQQEYGGSSATEPGTFSTPAVSKFADPPPPGGCRSPAIYFADLPGSGGFFSTFRTAFTFNGVGITGASVYVTGMPIGWHWNQIGTTFTGNSTSGCVFGTITYGIRTGSLTLGFIQPYHFSFNFNPVGCMLYFRQSSGGC